MAQRSNRVLIRRAALDLAEATARVLELSKVEPLQSDLLRDHIIEINRTARRITWLYWKQKKGEGNVRSIRRGTDIS